MLNILIYRKFEFVKSLYFVKGSSPDSPPNSVGQASRLSYIVAKDHPLTV